MSRYPQRRPEEEETLQAENVKILYRLQSSLTNTCLSGLMLFKPNLSSLHQVFVCRTLVLPQFNQFWDSLRSDIAQEGFYASIGGMNLQLHKLQDNDKESKVLRAGGLSEGWEKVKDVLQYWELPYVPEIIRSKMISCYYDNPLAEYFGIDKTKKLVGRKYY